MLDLSEILNDRRNPIAEVRVPIIEWLPHYTMTMLLQDLISGVTVFVLLVPQGMAYAMLGGMPPVYGLYSSTVPLLIYAIFSSSKQLSMGPMGVTSLLLGVSVQKYGYEAESPDYIRVASSLTLLTGYLLIFMGIFKLGSMVNIISRSVLVGFLTGSAVVIFISQIKNILGIHVPRLPYTHQVLLHICSHLPRTNIYSLVLGIVSIAFLLSVREWKKRNKVPPRSDSGLLHKILYRICATIATVGNLLCIIIGGAVAKMIILRGGELPIIGDVPSGLKAPSFNIVPMDELISLFPAAIAMAFVVFAGNWAVASKYAILNGYKVEGTQELIASGVCMAIGVFFHSFVISGGLARTAVNAESGAVTQISGCITAILMLVSLLTITSFFYYIPTASLGSIIIVAILSMIDFETMIKAYFIDKRDCLVMIVTFFCTVFLGVTEGLFIGIFLSFAIIMKSTAFPYIAHLGKLPENEGGHFKDVKRFPHAQQLPGFAIIRMDASLFFGNCEHFKDVVLAAGKGLYHTSTLPVHTIIVDASAWVDIDLAGMEILKDLKEELLKLGGVSLCLACAKGVIRHHLSESKGFAKLFPMFDSISDVIYGRPASRSGEFGINDKGSESSEVSSSSSRSRSALRAVSNIIFKNSNSIDAPGSQTLNPYLPNGSLGYTVLYDEDSNATGKDDLSGLEF